MLDKMLYFDVPWGILSPLNLHPKVGGGFPSAAHTKVWLLPVTRVVLSKREEIVGWPECRKNVQHVRNFTIDNHYNSLKRSPILSMNVIILSPIGITLSNNCQMVPHAHVGSRGPHMLIRL